MAEPTVKELEPKKDDHSGPTTDIPTQSMNFHPDIMRPKVASCIHITLHLYTQVRIKVMSEISNHICTETKHSLRTDYRLRSANEIFNVVATKPLTVC